MMKLLLLRIQKRSRGCRVAQRLKNNQFPAAGNNSRLASQCDIRPMKSCSLSEAKGNLGKLAGLILDYGQAAKPTKVLLSNHQYRKTRSEAGSPQPRLNLSSFRNYRINNPFRPCRRGRLEPELSSPSPESRSQGIRSSATDRRLKPRFAARCG